MSLEGDIATIYEDVRNDKSPTQWLLLGYSDDKSDKISLKATGEGGLDEFKSHLADDQAAYGFLRMTVGNDELSKRSKFVLITWCGPQVKVMRKAKLSVHIASVKAVLKNFAVELAATAKNEVNEKELTLLLKKAMGANYDRQTSTY